MSALELYRLYCRDHCRRRAPGRFIDNAALLISLTVGLAALFSLRLQAGPAFALAAVCGLCLVLAGVEAGERRRQKRFRAWRQKQIGELRRQELALLPKGDYLVLLRPGLEKRGLANARVIADRGYPGAELSGEAVWRFRSAAGAEGAVVVTTRRIGKEAQQLADEQAAHIQLISAFDLVEEDSLPQPGDADAVLTARLRQRLAEKYPRPSLKKRALALRYLLLAGVLLALSFFTAFPLWYRLAAAGCALGAAGWLLGSMTVREPS